MDTYLIWLSQIKSVGPVIQKRLLGAFENPEAIFRASKAELMCVQGVGPATAESILSSFSLEKAKRIRERTEKQGIKILSYLNPLYPELVKKLPLSPIVLYYLGSIKRDSMGVCIVGARRCTDYGKTVVRNAAGFLAQEGIPVISGLAKGIDGYAHTACLINDGYTLAFVGSGVDICYPKEHRELRDAISKNGAIISQYLPSTPPRAVNFPVRNYLMSAWSTKVLVVEAGEKSGSLITAQLAFEQGRQVLAVPNSIYCQESKGTNGLIAKGAEIYIHESQLLIDGRGSFTKNRGNSRVTDDRSKEQINLSSQEHLSPVEKMLSELITKEPQHIGKIGLSFSDAPSFLETLSIMELEGKIERLPGGMVCKR